MKIYLISDNKDTYTGMRLAGIEGMVVHEKDEFLRALEMVKQDKEVGLVLLTEYFGKKFPEIAEDLKMSSGTPLFVEIPDRHGTGRRPDFITSYINEAIGLKL